MIKQETLVGCGGAKEKKNGVYNTKFHLSHLKNFVSAFANVGTTLYDVHKGTDFFSMLLIFYRTTFLLQNLKKTKKTVMKVRETRNLVEAIKDASILQWII